MRDGKTSGHWVWGTSLYTAGLVTVLGKAALITNIWTKYTVIAIPGSLAVWFVFLPVYAIVAPKLNFSTEYTNLLPVLLTDPKFWLMMIVLPAICLVRDLAWKYFKRMFRPESYHHVQEIQKYNIQDYRPRYVSPSWRRDRTRRRTAMMREYANAMAEWSNSKRRFEKSDRCKGCENSAGTRFHRRMRVRLGCCKLMIPHGREDGMERCRLVEGNRKLEICNEFWELYVVLVSESCLFKMMVMLYVYGHGMYMEWLDVKRWVRFSLRGML